MESNIPLGKHLRFFFSDYLPRQRNASPHTIQAYRDALKQILCFAGSLRNRSVVNLTLADIDRKTVLSFLEFIECRKGNSVSTRNHRLAAIRSFIRCIAQTTPEAIYHCNQILSIPIKRGETKSIGYLTKEEIMAILKQVSLVSLEGQRDDVLLRFLYNTGSRVQEALDVMTTDLRLDTPPSVRLCGKGRKERYCPIWPDTSDRLRLFLNRRNIKINESVYVFTNRHETPLTRSGVNYILKKYVRLASVDCPFLETKCVHPHLIRHTCAMHLLQSGVDLNTIRCWLGHSSVTTTNKYVEIDLEMKKRALDNMTLESNENEDQILEDDQLIAWLETL